MATWKSKFDLKSNHVLKFSKMAKKGSVWYTTIRSNLSNATAWATTLTWKHSNTDCVSNPNLGWRRLTKWKSFQLAASDRAQMTHVTELTLFSARMTNFIPRAFLRKGASKSFKWASIRDTRDMNWWAAFQSASWSERLGTDILHKKSKILRNFTRHTSIQMTYHMQIG